MLFFPPSQVINMAQAAQSSSVIESHLRQPHFYQRAALLATILVLVQAHLWGQKAAAAAEKQSTSLAGPLQNADQGTELHIFYVHGMGITSPKGERKKHRPQNFDTSEEFRTEFCKKVVHCEPSNPKGEPLGRNYANEAFFKPGSTNDLMYLGEKVWRSPEEWSAAAPFADNYKLVRTDGPTIYFHEINWWPLVLSAKCRQIVAREIALVDLDKIHTDICKAATVPDGNGRFRSYTWWIDKDEERVPPWPKAAVLNRWLKHDILDWGFGDALLAVGPLHNYLVQGIREVVLDSITTGRDDGDMAKNHREFIIVSHSLGSYLMFSELDLQIGSTPSPGSLQGDVPAPTPNSQGVSSSTTNRDWREEFENVLRKTSHAYFMANQVRLLELANLDKTKNAGPDNRGNLITHLQTWSDLRADAKQPRPRIVAFSDPDDLLTWQLPEQANQEDEKGNCVILSNRPAKNAWRWLWLFANPETAHLDYDRNKQVIGAMVPQSNSLPFQPIAPDEPCEAATRSTQ
jgi:hypothetical protein